jgi:ribose 5-phosphate isomerase A
MSMEAMKRAAAAEALKLVEPGMKLGLGTGSTARHFVDLLGEKVAAGLKIVGVPTSEATGAQAKALNIPLSTLDDLVSLDLTIDGADEIDPPLNLIKGGGGAHLREKIVAAASTRMVVIADSSKIVERLGAFPLPVEIVKFGVGATTLKVKKIFENQSLDATLRLRPAKDGSRFITDEGNLILDANLGSQRIADPARLGAALAEIPGVVEHGLFVGLCSAAYVASETGVVRLDGSA